MIPLEEFFDSYKRIKSYIRPTPVIKSQWLSNAVNGTVYLKLENLNPGKSFKIRGATNALLSQATLPEMVITASGGNHGLGVALAAKAQQIPCHVVLPLSTSKYRIKLLEELGAEVELYGEAWDEANKYALRLAEEEGSLYIHPFADREVIIGQGTIVIELQQQLGDFDKIDNFVASVGGGGLLGGNALALEAMKHSAKIIAVETKGADSLAVSLQADSLKELDAITSIAKTLGAKTTTPFIFQTMQRLVNEMLVVSDKEAVESMISFLDQEKMLLEPATSCSVSAVLQNKHLFEGKTSVIIICGSNVSYNEALNWQKQFDL